MFELGLPRSPRFLINTVILTILLFISYYGLLPFIADNSLHKRLTDAYYKDFWQEPQLESAAGVSLQIVWPRFVSSLVEREIVISLTNNSDFDIEPIVVIFAIFPETASNESPLQQWLMWQTESQFGSNSYNGRSILNLGTIPPNGQVTQSIWVRMSPAGNTPDQIPFDAYVQWTYPHDTDLTCETDETAGQDKKICILRVAPAPEAKVDSLKTIRQGIVRVLLLPPLTNLFLPLLALFLSLSFEGVSATIANDFARNNKPRQTVGRGGDPVTPPDNGSEEVGNIADSGRTRPPLSIESGSAQEPGGSNRNRFIQFIQELTVGMLSRAGGILSLAGLIIYAILLLCLIVDIVVGWLDPNKSSNVIFFWVFVLVTVPILFYAQKQQKDGWHELADSLEKPLPVSIIQTDQELSTRIEMVRSDLQQAVESLRNSVQQDPSRRLQDLNEEIARLKEQINISCSGSDTEVHTSLEAQIAELRESCSTQGIQLVHQQLEEQIVSLKKQFAEETPAMVDKEITALKKQLGSKLNSSKYNGQIKKFRAVIGFSLTSLDELQRVEKLIIRVEEFRKSYPSEPEQARVYWQELANCFNENAHWEVKQRYLARYDKLQDWFNGIELADEEQIG